MVFVKGDPRINRAGRPKEKTIKERVREWLEENPNDMKAFVEHFVKKNKELAWQMMEGMPKRFDQLDVKLPQNLIDLIRGTSDQPGNQNIPAEN